MILEDLLAERGWSILDVSYAEMMQPTCPPEGSTNAFRFLLPSGLYGGMGMLENAASDIADPDD